MKYWNVIDVAYAIRSNEEDVVEDPRLAQQYDPDGKSGGNPGNKCSSSLFSLGPSVILNYKDHKYK